MKKIVFITLSVVAFAVACGNGYQKGGVGKWNAGKATTERDMIVIVRGDGTFTAEIEGSDMKPAPGTWRIKKDRIYLSFPKIELSYRIDSLDAETMVMSSKYARLTWRRVE